MKRILICLIALLLATGCSQIERQLGGNSGATGGGSVSVEVEKKDVNKSAFNSDAILDKIVTTAYTWNSKYDNCLALVIKNTSTLDCELNAEVSFKDAEGNLLGVKEDTVYAFGVGGEVCLVFDNEEPFESYEYEYSVKELEYYGAVDSNLKCEAVPAKDKLIVSVTNNGSEVAEFVTATALFMSGDKVTGYSRTYVGDDDSEIKAGSKETDEIHYYEEFDEAKVYLSGYCDKVID